MSEDIKRELARHYGDPTLTRDPVIAQGEREFMQDRYRLPPIPAPQQYWEAPPPRPGQTAEEEAAARLGSNLARGREMDPWGLLSDVGTLAMGVAPMGRRIAQPFRAWQGSPYDHSGWDPAFIGRGQGSRTYGHGHYFGDEKKVGEEYRKEMAGKPDAFTEYSVKTPGGGVLKIPGGSGDYTFQSRPEGGREGIDPALHHAANMAHWDGLRSSRAAAARWLKEAQRTEGWGTPGSSGLPQSAEYYQKLYDYLMGLRPGDVSATRGRLFEVDIHHPKESLLNWDLPLRKQDPGVRGKLIDWAAERANDVNETRRRVLERGTDSFGRPLSQDRIERMRLLQEPEAMTGEQVYKGLEAHLGGKAPGEKAAEASAWLFDRGIPGLRYLDEKSRQYLGHDFDLSLQQWKQELAKRERYAAENPLKPAGLQEARDKITYFQRRLRDANNATSNTVMFPGSEPDIEIVGKHAFGGGING